MNLVALLTSKVPVAISDPKTPVGVPSVPMSAGAGSRSKDIAKAKEPEVVTETRSTRTLPKAVAAKAKSVGPLVRAPPPQFSAPAGVQRLVLLHRR